MLLFSMGSIGAAVTALRLWKVVVLYRIYGREVNSVRWFVGVVYVVLLSQAEASTLVVCANLPALAALLKRRVAAPATAHGSRRWWTRLLTATGHAPSSSSRQPSTRRRRRWLWWSWQAGSRSGDGRGAGADVGAGGLESSEGGEAGAGAGGGAFAVRLKALRSPDRSFTRSAQDAATACNESVVNMVVVREAERGVDDDDDDDDGDAGGGMDDGGFNGDADVERAAAAGGVRRGRNTRSAGGSGGIRVMRSTTIRVERKAIKTDALPAASTR
jgi:hypothetical protein